jgi:hypothetical protein
LHVTSVIRVLTVVFALMFVGLAFGCARDKLLAVKFRELSVGVPKALVLAKLGAPDREMNSVQSLNTSSGHSHRCSNFVGYLPWIDIFDELYIVCFDANDHVRDKMRLVSQ